MAVIKTLLLQVCYLLSLLGAVQAVDKVNTASLAAGASTTKTCGKPLTLICTDKGSGGSSGNVQINNVQFYKDGVAIPGGWADISSNTKDIATMFLDVSHNGVYTCQGAHDGAGAKAGDNSTAITVDCKKCGYRTASGNPEVECIDKKVTCKKAAAAAATDRSCTCIVGPATFANVAGCYECTSSNLKLCEATKQHCTTNHKCDTPPTSGSGTKPTTGAAVTSSAGKITSTACLVIASVVVALMI